MHDIFIRIILHRLVADLPPRQLLLHRLDVLRSVVAPDQDHQVVHQLRRDVLEVLHQPIPALQLQQVVSIIAVSLEGSSHALEECFEDGVGPDILDVFFDEHVGEEALEDEADFFEEFDDVVVLGGAVELEVEVDFEGALPPVVVELGHDVGGLVPGDVLHEVELVLDEGALGVVLDEEDEVADVLVELLLDLDALDVVDGADEPLVAVELAVVGDARELHDGERDVLVREGDLDAGHDLAVDRVDVQQQAGAVAELAEVEFEPVVVEGVVGELVLELDELVVDLPRLERRVEHSHQLLVLVVPLLRLHLDPREVVLLLLLLLLPLQELLLHHRLHHPALLARLHVLEGPVDLVQLLVVLALVHPVAHQLRHPVHVVTVRQLRRVRLALLQLLVPPPQCHPPHALHQHLLLARSLLLDRTSQVAPNADSQVVTASTQVLHHVARHPSLSRLHPLLPLNLRLHLRPVALLRTQRPHHRARRPLARLLLHQLHVPQVQLAPRLRVAVDRVHAHPVLHLEPREVVLVAVLRLRRQQVRDRVVEVALEIPEPLKVVLRYHPDLLQTTRLQYLLLQLLLLFQRRIIREEISYILVIEVVAKSLEEFIVEDVFLIPFYVALHLASQVVQNLKGYLLLIILNNFEESVDFYEIDQVLDWAELPFLLEDADHVKQFLVSGSG